MDNTECANEWVHYVAKYPNKNNFWYLCDRKTRRVLVRINSLMNGFWVICKSDGRQTNHIYDSLKFAKKYAEENHTEIEDLDLNFDYSVCGKLSPAITNLSSEV